MVERWIVANLPIEPLSEVKVRCLNIIPCGWRTNTWGFVKGFVTPEVREHRLETGKYGLTGVTGVWREWLDRWTMTMEMEWLGWVDVRLYSWLDKDWIHDWIDIGIDCKHVIQLCLKFPAVSCAFAASLPYRKTWLKTRLSGKSSGLCDKAM